VGNAAGDAGGAIYNSDELGGHCTLTLNNSILWGDSPDEIVDAFGAETTVSYSDVQGGWSGAGSNNIDEDPLFVGGPSGAWTSAGVYEPSTGCTTFTDDTADWDEGGLAGEFLNPEAETQYLQSLIVSNMTTTVTVWGDFAAVGQPGNWYQVYDYHLSPGSPCIDAADNTAVPPDEFDLDGDEDFEEPIPYDLDGNPRFVDDPCTIDTGNPDPDYADLPIVDMGSYEYQPCGGDVDCDGDTDHADLGALLSAWCSVEGDSNWNANADLDGDGHIGQGDLGILLADWGCGTP
jgi:hypothetical protein